MKDDKFVIIKESVIGTDTITKDLEKSFLKSCEYNNTNPDDIAYFRSYVWNLFAMLLLKMENKKDE